MATTIETDAELRALLRSDTSVLVDFFAPWCGPCKKIAPLFSELAEQHPELKFCKVDVDECEAVCEELGVESLPPSPGQKTWFPKAVDTAAAAKSWYVVDAEGMRLGRMASECAKVLLGKNKPTFTPGADVGDALVIINAEKVIVTGNKNKEKLYRRHSGRPGGMKIESYEELQARKPERIVEKAIVGMLPKNSHGRQLFRHLKVYKGSNHPHDAQQPTPLTFSGLTVTEDTRLLKLEDPDATTCAN